MLGSGHKLNGSLLFNQVKSNIYMKIRFSDILHFSYRKRVKKSKMINSSVHFIINLAIADILKVLIDLPMTGISSFYGRWVFGEIGWHFFD
jgi:hypothetical protein